MCAGFLFLVLGGLIEAPHFDAEPAVFDLTDDYAVGNHLNKARPGRFVALIEPADLGFAVEDGFQFGRQIEFNAEDILHFDVHDVRGLCVRLDEFVAFDVLGHVRGTDDHDIRQIIVHVLQCSPEKSFALDPDIVGDAALNIAGGDGRFGGWGGGPFHAVCDGLEVRYL